MGRTNIYFNRQIYISIHKLIFPSANKFCQPTKNFVNGRIKFLSAHTTQINFLSEKNKTADVDLIPSVDFVSLIDHGHGQQPMKMHTEVTSYIYIYIYIYIYTLYLQAAIYIQYL